jgi:putative restriction endonuclease
MSTEPFWTLVPNPGCEIWVQSKSSMRSFSNLTTAIKYALIDNELVELLRSKDDSEMILHFLLETYFCETKGNFLISGNNYISEIESQISEDNREEYARRILKIKEELNSEEFQEEIFIRGSLFKREIPKIYNNTCAISGMRIDAVDNISMIDACHIVPFSESYDDTLPNGIALCPNLHRAFDRGLIFINDEYRVVVNKNFFEPNPSKYSIGQFDNIKILTPILEYHHPAKEALAWHMKKWRFTKVN